MLGYKLDAIGNNWNADIKRGPRETDDIQHTGCPRGAVTHKSPQQVSPDCTCPFRVSDTGVEDGRKGVKYRKGDVYERSGYFVIKIM